MGVEEEEGGEGFSSKDPSGTALNQVSTRQGIDPRHIQSVKDESSPLPWLQELGITGGQQAGKQHIPLSPANAHWVGKIMTFTWSPESDRFFNG